SMLNRLRKNPSTILRARYGLLPNDQTGRSYQEVSLVVFRQDNYKRALRETQQATQLVRGYMRSYGVHGFKYPKRFDPSPALVTDKLQLLSDEQGYPFLGEVDDLVDQIQQYH